MKKALLPILLCLAAGLFFLLKPASPHYIFLITLDTARADFFNPHEKGKHFSPNFEKYAGEGLVFKHAYSLIPITLPSHASMFYSRYPHEIKIYNNGDNPKITLPSLAQLLKNSGFQTGAVVSLGVLKSMFGLNRGFDEYRDRFKPYLFYKTAAEVNRESFNLIERMKGKNGFIWIHYSDPHEPYFPPCYQGKFSITLNQKVVFAADSIQQSAIERSIILQPGENILRLHTELPVQSSPSGRVGTELAGQFKFIKYGNFTLDAATGTAGLQIIYPDSWEKKRGKGDAHYFSPEVSSNLKIINRNPAPRQLKLAFNYFLYYNDAVRKRLYAEEIQYLD